MLHPLGIELGMLARNMNIDMAEIYLVPSQNTLMFALKTRNIHLSETAVCLELFAPYADTLWVSKLILLFASGRKVVTMSYSTLNGVWALLKAKVSDKVLSHI
jgi:hypothetical protein